MEKIIAIDNLILSFFTKISHKFYRLTGRTNFFLAKLAICVLVASTMTVIFSYWFPAILGFQPQSLLVALSGIVSVACLVNMVLCDKAEKSAFSDQRVRIFNPWYYSPLDRVIHVFMALICFFLIILYLNIDSGKGYFIFKALYSAFLPADVAFKYFISIDPPTPGKSKIREWVEAFSAGFQKLAQINVRN